MNNLEEREKIYIKKKRKEEIFEGTQEKIAKRNLFE